MPFSALITSLLCLALPAQAPPKIEGYAQTLSVAQGEPVGIAVSTTAPSYSVEVVRVGAKVVSYWTKADVKGTSYPIPRDVSPDGCRWPEAFQVPVGLDWPSGYYLARLKPENAPPNTPSAEAYFIVRPREPGKNAKILLQLSTNTYNAYNNYGGYSLYAYHAKDKVQGRCVSFDRPGGSQFANWEAPFTAWAERNGYAIDYAANSDLELRPEILKPYKLVLSVGHDEYWSKPMRDNLEAYIKDGGNVAFLSGNSVCWQIRTVANGRELVCWKQTFGDDPIYQTDDRRTLSTLWSHHLVARPENSLTGVGFLWGGYHLSHGQYMNGSGAFTTHQPDHWVFADTKLKRDQPFGGKHTVVGYECDGCEMTWRDGLPYPTHRDGTPETFVILATAPARWHPDDCEWYEKWEKGREGHAVMGIYTRGGTVVTTGSTDWAHGLRGGDEMVETITKNILNRLGK